MRVLFLVALLALGVNGAGHASNGNDIAMGDRISETAGTTTIIVYEHQSFNNSKSGRSLTITGDIKNLNDVGWHSGFFNDRISSIHVISGTWDFYEDDQFKGKKITLKAGDKVSWLNDDTLKMDDMISSIKLVKS